MQRGRQLMLVVLIAGLATLTRSTRRLAFEQHLAGRHYEDVYYLPGADTLPMLSLGYQAALADLIWCKSLVYFGEELGQHGVVKFVFAYTDAVLALDPSFRAAYRWAPTAAIYRPAAVGLAGGEQGADYLRQAVQRWPNDGELQWDYGSYLRFELAPLAADPQHKRALLQRATPHLELAARLGAGPPWLALNNAQLLDKLGRTDQAVRQLEELHSTVQSDAVRSDIEWQLRRLKAETYLQAKEVADQTFAVEHARSYPYLSDGLFFLLGPKESSEAYERSLAVGFEEPERTAAKVDDAE